MRYAGVELIRPRAAESVRHINLISVLRDGRRTGVIVLAEGQEPS